jgi:prepilin-type N-terminal cleavage/methylation domain-containing protein
MKTTPILRALRDARGFTLTELLIVVAIVGFILAGVFTLQLQAQWAYMMGAARVETQQTARMALDRFIDELRLATAVTASPSWHNVANGGTSLSFSWTNPSTLATETVTYDLSGTNMRRTDAGGTVTLIGGVTALNIWCFQSDGTTLTATPANVQSVRVQIATQDETVANQRQRAVVLSQVRLRNL